MPFRLAGNNKKGPSRVSAGQAFSCKTGDYLLSRFNPLPSAQRA